MSVPAELCPSKVPSTSTNFIESVKKVGKPDITITSSITGTTDTFLKSKPLSIFIPQSSVIPLSANASDESLSPSLTYGRLKKPPEPPSPTALMQSAFIASAIPPHVPFPPNFSVPPPPIPQPPLLSSSHISANANLLITPPPPPPLVSYFLDVAYIYI